MLKIGLTGGIGSGKTTIAKIFEELGTPIYYADIEAKKILCTDIIKSRIRDKWGSTLFFENGNINKAELANIVFNDNTELQFLNSIIHPQLMKDFEYWAKNKELQNNNYVIMEAAILFEAGFHLDVDKVVCISAPEDERIKRVMARDNVTKDQVISRIKSQWPQDKIIEISDYEIKNSENDLILKPISLLHELFSKQLKKS